MPSDDVQLERLTYDEVDLVLRRATELQHGEPSADANFTLAEVERLGAEIGLSPQAVRTALVHVRTGALVPTSTKPSLADRLIGPTQIVARRRVRGPAYEVRARVDDFMRKQLLRVKRNFGDRVQWERAEGLFSQVRRALDLGDQYSLRDAEEIESSVIELPGDTGEVEIVFVGRFPDTRRDQATGVLVGAGLMTAGGLLGATFLAPLALTYAVIAAASGVGMSALVVTGTRRSYLEKLDRVRDALERLLDNLEHER